MTSKQTVVVYRNPEGCLVLVYEEDIVVKATQPTFIGMQQGEADITATSVMRWWNPARHDNDYPERVMVP